MGSIMDVFFKAVLDDSKLLIDATKSGDNAGEALGSRMSAKLSTALSIGAKAGFGVLAGGAAIAVRGLQELDGITAKFAADTGASAEEAKRAGVAINEMGGHNLQTLSEIGDALTVVHTDLGLTGAAAEKATDQFLKYATATGQNATSAIKAFDDVLDAWGLTASDAQGIMDKLIVSHQKYGGSIEENQRALAAFAPQLTALNATIDDGIGLLNLFAASGLDASAATRALNSAVANLKPGQSLNDLIKQISSIEDPTKRAQEAIKIFGARGGVALANALKPGVQSLKDFEVSAADAAGATQKASDAIEGTFGNRVKLAIKAVGAEIIGLGQSFGPALTGLASLASLAGSLGGGKLAKGIVKGLEGIGPKIAAAIAGAELGTRLETLGLTAQTLWIKGLTQVDRLRNALQMALDPVFGRLGETSAGKFVTNFLASSGLKGFAARVVSLVGVIAIPATIAIAVGGPIAQGIQDANQKQLHDELTKALVDGSAQAIEDARTRLAQLERGARAAHLDSWLGIVIGEKQAFEEGLRTRLEGTKDAGQFAVQEFDAGVKSAAPTVHRDIAAFVGKIKDDLSGAAQRQGNLAAGALAQAMLAGRQNVDQAWQALLDGIKNSQSVTAQTARLTGELASKELIAGLKDKDPAVRAQARYTKQLIIDQLNELKPRAGTLSKDAMENLRRAMKSKDPDIRATATDIYNAAIGKGKGKGPSDLPAAGTSAGSKLTGNLETQIDRGKGPVGDAAARLARAIFQRLLGTMSFQFANEVDVRHQHRASGGPVTAGVPYIVGETRPELFVPNVSGLILPRVPNVITAGGDTTYNTTNIVKVDGLLKARDPLELGQRLARFAQTGVFEPKKVPA